MAQVTHAARLKTNPDTKYVEMSLSVGDNTVVFQKPEKQGAERSHQYQHQDKQTFPEVSWCCFSKV